MVQRQFLQESISAQNTPRTQHAGGNAPMTAPQATSSQYQQQQQQQQTVGGGVTPFARASKTRSTFHGKETSVNRVSVSEFWNTAELWG